MIASPDSRISTTDWSVKPKVTLTGPLRFGNDDPLPFRNRSLWSRISVVITVGPENIHQWSEIKHDVILDIDINLFTLSGSTRMIMTKKF